MVGMVVVVVVGGREEKQSNDIIASHHCFAALLRISMSMSISISMSMSRSVAAPVIRLGIVLAAVWRRCRAGEMVPVVQERVGDILVFLVVLPVCVFPPPSSQTGLVLGLLVYVVVFAADYTQHFGAEDGTRIR